MQNDGITTGLFQKAKNAISTAREASDIKRIIRNTENTHPDPEDRTVLLWVVAKQSKPGSSMERLYSEAAVDCAKKLVRDEDGKITALEFLTEMNESRKDSPLVGLSHKAVLDIVNGQKTAQARLTALTQAACFAKPKSELAADLMSRFETQASKTFSDLAQRMEVYEKCHEIAAAKEGKNSLQVKRMVNALIKKENGNGPRADRPSSASAPLSGGPKI